MAVATCLLAGLALVGCSKNPSLALGDAAIQSVEVVASISGAAHPLDAAPDPGGRAIFFSTSGSPTGIFKVATSGGSLVTVTVGSPLKEPRGVAVGSDGSHVYIADPQANAVFSVNSTGGTAAMVTGTQGWSPRGLDLLATTNGDVLYFTATDPTDKAAGVFSVPAAGGAVSAVAKGGSFTSPDGVVVAAPGVAYVTDHGSGAQGSVLKVSNGSVSVLVGGSRLGNPAGITLNGTRKQLMVSTIDADSGSDQLLFIDLASGKTGVATKVIGANHNSSGGLHRAGDGSVFAWADTTRQVYQVRLER